MNPSNYNIPFIIPSLGELLSQELNQLSLPNLKKVAGDLKLNSSLKKKQLQNEIHKMIISKMNTENSLIMDHSFPGLLNLEVPLLKSNPLLRQAVEKYNDLIRKSQQNPSFTNVFPNQSFFIPNIALFRPTTSHHLNDYTMLNNMSNSRNSCFCGGLIFKPPHIKPQSLNFLQCINEKCRRNFHIECLKISDKEVEKEISTFECPSCVLLKNDPLHEVLDILSGPFLITQSMQGQQEFVLDQQMMKKMYEDPEIGVEIKCLKLEGRYLIEQTWLDSGDLYINNKKVLEFKPLQINSALKKRKDEKFYTRDNLLALNSVKLNDIKPVYEMRNSVRYDDHSIYMAGVYLVRRLKTTELIEKIQNTSVKEINICKEDIAKELDNKHLDDCKIETDRLSISLIDTLDRQLIKTPARSRFCNHLQCFSLENIIKLTETTIPRKWRCPICKVKAFDLIIDGYLCSVLNEIHGKGLHNTTEIVFFKDGVYELKGIEEEKPDDDPKASPLSHTEPVPTNDAKKQVQKQQNNIIILDDDDDENENLNPNNIRSSNNLETSNENQINLSNKLNVSNQINMDNLQINEEQTQVPNQTNSDPSNEKDINNNTMELETINLPLPENIESTEKLDLNPNNTSNQLNQNNQSMEIEPFQSNQIENIIPLPPNSPFQNENKPIAAPNVIIVEQESEPEPDIRFPPPNNLNLLKNSLENFKVMFKEKENHLQIHKNITKIREFSEFINLNNDQFPSTMDLEHEQSPNKTLKPNLKSRTFFIKGFKKQYSEYFVCKEKEKDKHSNHNESNINLNISNITQSQNNMQSTQFNIPQPKPLTTEIMIDNELKRLGNNYINPVFAGIINNNASQFMNNINLGCNNANNNGFMSNKKFMSNLNNFNFMDNNSDNIIKNLNINQPLRIETPIRKMPPIVKTAANNNMKRPMEKDKEKDRERGRENNSLNIQNAIKKKNENNKIRIELKEKGQMDNPICLD